MLRLVRKCHRACKGQRGGFTLCCSVCGWAPSDVAQLGWFPQGGYNSSAVYALSEASGFNPLLFGLAATRGATPGSVDVELLPLGSVPPRISAVLALAVQGAVSSSPLLSPPSTSAAVSGGVRVTHAQQVLCEVVGCLARGIGVLHPSLLFSPFVTSRQSHSVWGFAGSASSDEPVPLQAVDALPSLHSQCSKGTLLYSVLKTLHGFGPTSSPDALAVLLHCLCQCTLPPMPLRPVVALAHSVQVSSSAQPALSLVHVFPLASQMSAPDPHPLKVIAYEFALAHCERDLSLVQWLVSQCDNAPRLSPSCLEPLFSGIATLGLLLPPSRFLQLVGTVISAIEGFGSGAMWPHFGGVLASFDSAMETEASQASLSPALCQLLVPRVLSACPASVWSHREDPARAVVLSLVHALARLPPATVEPALFLSVEGTSGLLRDPRVAADALLALARCSLMSAGILDLQQAPVLRYGPAVCLPCSYMRVQYFGWLENAALCLISSAHARVEAVL